MTETSTPPAAWYPDPHGRHEHRWWDGNGWTEQVADGGQSSTDPVGAPASEATATATTETTEVLEDGGAALLAADSLLFTRQGATRWFTITEPGGRAVGVADAGPPFIHPKATLTYAISTGRTPIVTTTFGKGAFRYGEVTDAAGQRLGVRKIGMNPLETFHIDGVTVAEVHTLTGPEPRPALLAESQAVFGAHVGPRGTGAHQVRGPDGSVAADVLDISPDIGQAQNQFVVLHRQSADARLRLLAIMNPPLRLRRPKLRK